MLNAALYDMTVRMLSSVANQSPAPVSLAVDVETCGQLADK